MNSHLRLCAIALAAAAVAESGAFSAERQASITATGGLSASSNPFLSTSGNADAMLSEITVHPVLTSKTETSSVELSGTAGHRRYSRHYGSYFYGNGLLSGSVKQNEHLELRGSAHYRHEVSADVIDDISGAVDPRSVRKSLGAEASASLGLSEQTILSPKVSAERISYTDSDELESYERLDSSLGLSRQVNEYTNVGLSGGASFFRNHASPDSNVFSATATVQHKLTPSLEIEGALGLERADLGGDQGHPDSNAQIMFAGNGRLCRRGEWTNLCLTSAVSSEPSGLGTLERRISGGLSYGLRLGEFSNLALSADYQRSSAISAAIDDPLQYLQARAAFDKQLSRSLTLDAFLNYRRRAGIVSAGSATAGVNLRWMTGRN